MPTAPSPHVETPSGMVASGGDLRRRARGFPAAVVQTSESDVGRRPARPCDCSVPPPLPPRGGSTTCLTQPLRGLRSPQDMCGVQCSFNRPNSCPLPDPRCHRGLLRATEEDLYFPQKRHLASAPRRADRVAQLPLAEQGGLWPEPLALGSPGCVTLGRSQALSKLLCRR